MPPSQFLSARNATATVYIGKPAIVDVSLQRTTTRSVPADSLSSTMRPAGGCNRASEIDRTCASTRIRCQRGQQDSWRDFVQYARPTHGEIDTTCGNDIYVEEVCHRLKNAGCKFNEVKRENGTHRELSSFHWALPLRDTSISNLFTTFALFAG